MDYTSLLQKLSESNIDPELLARINNLGQNHKDALTGLLDFRSFSWQLEEKLKEPADFSLLAISIDFLQELNLISGWVVGDLALCTLAALMEAPDLPAGLSGRISGATLMIYTTETDLGKLKSWLSELSAEMARFDFPDLAMFPEEHLTLSAGIYSHHKGKTTATAAINEARQRLQFAQRQGGNTIIVLSEKQAVIQNSTSQQVDVTVKNSNLPSWQDTRFQELSLHGISVILKAPVLVREPLQIKVHSTSHPELDMVLEGEVVWRKPIDQADHSSEFCLGIKFTNMSTEQIDYLEQMMTGVN